MLLPSPIAWLSAVAACAVAAVVDWRTSRIPNPLTLTAAAVGLAMNALEAGMGDDGGVYFSLGPRNGLLGAALGFLVMLCVAVVSRGGGGDVKLAAALGAILGPAAAFQAIGVTCLAAFACTFAFLILRDGPVAAIRSLIRSRPQTHNQAPGETAYPPGSLRVPLGPFFLIGTVTAAIYSSLRL